MDDTQPLDALSAELRTLNGIKPLIGSRVLIFAHAHTLHCPKKAFRETDGPAGEVHEAGAGLSPNPGPSGSIKHPL